MKWKKRLRKQFNELKWQWTTFRHPPLTWIIWWELRKLMPRQAICFVRGHDRTPRIYWSSGDDRVLLKNMPQCKRCYAAPYVDRMNMSEIVGR
jgi:hypothetical protein